MLKRIVHGKSENCWTGFLLSRTLPKPFSDSLRDVTQIGRENRFLGEYVLGHKS